MKKYLMTMIFIVFALSCVAETIYLGENLRKTRNERGENTLNTPFAKIDVADDSTAVTFTFSIPSVEVDMDSVLYPNSYWWRAHGFYPSMEPGAPALPQRSAIVRMPLTAKNIKLTVNHANWQNVEGYVPTPARPILEEDDVIFSVLNVPLISDYTDADQPVASISYIGKEEDTQMVYVHIAPFRYTGLNAPVQACYDFSFTVSYEANDSDELKKNVDSGSESSGNRRTVTPIDRPDFPFGPIDSVPLMPGDSLIKYNGEIYNINSIKNNYLVITTPKYERYFPPFVKWKNKLGHEVKIISREKWTTSEIVDTIKKVYNSGFSLKYVLFAGTIDEIPAENCGTYHTDYYYACVDGPKDRNQDVFTGRLLVDEPSEMPVILNKLMKYPTMGLDNPNYHNHATHVAYFQAFKDNPTVESYPFVSTSENIRNHAMKNGMTVKRIYTKQPGSTPTYWNSWYESRHNQLMPEELREPNFAWNGTAPEVISSFREGNLYIFYNGHGGETSWDSPDFMVGGLSFFNTENNLPVVFSMACLTGTFYYPGGFAKKLMTSKNGAISVFASEGKPSVQFMSVMELGIFNHIWLDAEYDSSLLDLSRTPVMPIEASLQQQFNKNDVDDLVLGRIVREGEHYMNYISRNIYSDDDNVKTDMQYEMAKFHIFGDPGMTMYTGVPYVITNPHISIMTNPSDTTSFKVEVSVGMPSVIGIYNETKNTVYRNYVRTRTLLCDKQDVVHISIQQYNSVPFFFEIKNGIVSASGSFIRDNTSTILPKLEVIKQTSPNTVSINYSLGASESISNVGISTVSLLTLDNNLLASQFVSDYENNVQLTSTRLSPGIYVVVLQTPNGESDYKKILIR